MRQIWKDMGLALLLSYLLGMILFPERFIYFNPTFVDYTDSPLSYAGAYYITNALYHGGIQLWNRFDQMPITFFHLNFAMYKLSNVLTAVFYVLLSPFTDKPAQFFHSLFSFMFIVCALCVRIVSVYLLLSLFVRRRWILIAATVWGSLVLGPQFMMGFSTNIIYSLFPLLMYFLLRYFKELRFNHLFMFLATWGYCVSTDLFCGLGYLYQGTHFVVLPGIFWAAWYHQAKLKLFFASASKWQALQKVLRKEHVLKLLALGLLTLVMIAPTLYLIKANYHDYEFGVDNSRMKNPLSVKAYFTRPAAWAPQAEFLWRMVDYSENLWSLNWMYVGTGLVFFSLLGGVVLKDSRKWILWVALLFFFLINCPRDSTGLGALAHWTNALTNPVKFLPRSYHMSCAMLLPFLLLPLAAAGFEWFWENCVKGVLKNHRPLRLAWALFFVFAAAVFALLPVPSRKLFLAFAFLLAAAGALCLWSPPRPWMKKVTMACLAAFFILDGWAMSRYVRSLLDTVLVSPRPVLARPDIGLVEMDYQNPRILPLREYASLTHHSGLDTYLFEASTNMPGLTFTYTNFLRYYQPISNYLPRHRAFASWVKDGGLMHYYIQTDPRLMFLAPAAVADGPDQLRQVLLKGLGRSVAVIEGKPDLSNTIPDMVPADASLIPIKKVTIAWDKITVKKKGGLQLGSFAMPEDLPRYYSSTFLTADENLFHLFLGQTPFKIAQGSLIVPGTFDVNDVRDGFVSFVLPPAFSREKDEITFIYPVRPQEGMVDVFKNHMDDFGFTYQTDKGGWLILHQPFDPKWELIVDGKKTEFYKANSSFIGVPLKAGRHEILLRYWPHTPIRFFLGLAVLVSVAFQFWILAAAVRSRAE